MLGINLFRHGSLHYYHKSHIAGCSFMGMHLHAGANSFFVTSEVVLRNGGRNGFYGRCSR